MIAMNDILYVAAEGDNAIYKLKGAGTTTTNLGKGKVVFDDQTVLHGPLGLIFAPNGDLIMANADPAHFPPTATDPSEIIEITRGGTFVRKFSIDPNPGAAFAVLVKGEDRPFGEDDHGSTPKIVVPNSSSTSMISFPTASFGN